MTVYHPSDPSSKEGVADDETYLPPRRAVHPSEKGKWTRRFYVTLLWLFVLLVAALFVWGFHTEKLFQNGAASGVATLVNVSTPPLNCSLRYESI